MQTGDRIQLQLSSYAAGLAYEHFDDDTVHAAKVRVIDTFGALVGGEQVRHQWLRAASHLYSGAARAGNRHEALPAWTAQGYEGPLHKSLVPMRCSPHLRRQLSSGAAPDRARRQTAVQIGTAVRRAQWRAKAVAVMNPTPGMVSSRWLAGFVRCHRSSSVSMLRICMVRASIS